jgi:hypothetical protein
VLLASLVFFLTFLYFLSLMAFKLVCCRPSKMASSVPLVH